MSSYAVLLITYKFALHTKYLIATHALPEFVQPSGLARKSILHTKIA